MKKFAKPGRPQLPHSQKKSKALLVRVDPQTRTAISAMALRRGTTVSEMTRKLMLDALQHA
jgi:predicted HicB family RNase H-like nuclease